MATIEKLGTKWRARVRRTGFPVASEMFDTKARATAWAAQVEADMRGMRYKDGRMIADMTVGDLIDRYFKEIDPVKPFGDNKRAVLKSLKTALGTILLPHLTVERLIKYLRDRITAGAGGVTIGIDLTYLAAVLKAAKQLWRLPVDLDVVPATRANMEHLGLSTRSKERTRRPTEEELGALCRHFDAKARQRIPMADLIRFAVGTAMRLGEIISLNWADLNESDRTVTIRNRKHPREKRGNDQEVPLLGEMFDLVKRQPRIDGEERIFPVTEGTVSSIFPRACNALAIQDLRFHDLRHEGVSRLFEAGFRIEEVALISGHRDWKMLARYTQIKARSLHRAKP